MMKLDESGLDVPEPETELKPIPNPVDKPNEDRDLKKVDVFKVAQPVCPGTKLTFWEKTWIGTKHFIYGFILSGVPALAISHEPVYLLVSGAIGGVLAAWRKTAKDNAVARGSDWPDVLDKLLSVILALIQAWRKSREVKK